MKGFVITLPDEWEKVSQQSAQRCVYSIESTGSKIDPSIFDATTPPTIKEGMIEAFGCEVKWNWPVDEIKNGYDLKTGLYKKRYPARDHLRVVSCAVSHARLWKRCLDLGEPIVILEHDSVFTRKFDPAILDGWNWGAVGLNDPRGATRKSSKFFRMINSQTKNAPTLHKVPNVDEENEPRQPTGLAGNSAYVLKPFAAKELLDTTKEVGLWPNDALMCSQLFRWLRVITPFYTKLQNVKSTTTG